MTKDEARTYARRLRKQLGQSAYQQANLQLYQQLYPLIEGQNPNIVHCFLPNAKRKEVDTWPAIRWLWKRNIKVVTSVSHIHNNSMRHFYLEEHTLLLENKWGIAEPTGDKLTEISSYDIDMVLLPLMAYDRQGQRVGYGKGYYDRFLSTCPPETIKVGLSLFSPVENITDVNTLDISMDVVVTTDKIWWFTES